MQETKYKRISNFLRHLPLEKFPLVQHYIDYDDCYSDNRWVTYTLFRLKEKNIPLAVIAERLPIGNPRHILIFEVNSDYIHKGYGKKCLLKYMEKSPNWELIALDGAEGFYRKIGFQEENDIFTYKKDNI